MKLFWKLVMCCVLGASVAGITPAMAGDNKAAPAKKDQVLPPKTAATRPQAPPGQAYDPSGKLLEGSAVCLGCHDENSTKPVLDMFKTPHGNTADKRTPSCQSCHGTSADHVANAAGAETRPTPDFTFGPKAKSEPQAQADRCLACHSGGNRMNWSGSTHETKEVTCTSCHTILTQKDPVLVKATQPEICFKCHKDRRAEIHKISTHPIDAGKMACSDCHNPHGSNGPKLLKKNTVNEVCYTCHPERRGPFLWEHRPVAEDCTNCHTPHGSNISPLLKQRVPFLCQSCHQTAGHNSKAEVSNGLPLANGGTNGLWPNTKAGNGYLAHAPDGSAYPGAPPNVPLNTNLHVLMKGCVSCHSQIHGSNDPAGEFFHR